VTAETHFVQAGDDPVLIGTGGGTLACTCGRVLVQGFEAARVLAVGIQCGQCGVVTTTAPLPDGELPPRSAIIAAPSTVPRDSAMTVPAGVPVVGQAEMARLQALFRPAAADTLYHVSPALLDEVVAGFAQLRGAVLPEADDGLTSHALGWAVRHLRGRLGSEAWACTEDAATAYAVTLVVGFQHFRATWSGHPLFVAMVETASDGGFCLHGLAPFAAAQGLMMMGNRIRFAEPLGYPGRIDGFELVNGANETVRVHVEAFDRFAFPSGRAWDPAGLAAAVAEVVAAAQGRINVRNPGVLVLSPGIAGGRFDEALVEAVKGSVQSLGRKNRGLMAVAPVMQRLQPLPDPHQVRFGFGIFPVANRHFRRDGTVPTGG
jgi:hypothetical protein